MQKKITTDYSEYSNLEELEPPIQALFSKAFEARENAYAPYSEFKVGCALQLANAEIVLGNNQENASYPVGICAERVALSSAGALFPSITIQKMAIVAGKNMNNENAVAPCGICRQTILEFQNKQNAPIEIYFMGTKGKVIHFASINDLMPFSFQGKDLV